MSIAIIIPAKNEEATLPKLLDSLAEQTEKPDEVLVVNSHSDDRTVEVARSYTKKLPLRTYDAKVRGVAAARNEGAAQVSSEILIFIDADVVLPADFIANTRMSLRKNPVDIGAFRQVMASGSAGLRLGAQAMNGYVRLMARTPWPIFFSCILIRRDLFEKVGGFDPEIFIMEDYDLALRARRSGGKFGIIKNAFFHASARRYENTDGAKSIFRGIYAEAYRYTHGMKITKPLFEYKMGGQRKSKDK